MWEQAYLGNSEDNLGGFRLPADAVWYLPLWSSLDGFHTRYGQEATLQRVLTALTVQPVGSAGDNKRWTGFVGIRVQDFIQSPDGAMQTTWATFIDNEPFTQGWLLSSFFSLGNPSDVAVYNVQAGGNVLDLKAKRKIRSNEMIYLVFGNHDESDDEMWIKWDYKILLQGNA